VLARWRRPPVRHRAHQALASAKIFSVSTRWQRTNAPRGDDYDARWSSLAAAGHRIHGEADLVEALLRESGGTRVLDAGCGTGRVATELARRGFSVVGVDADARMLASARAKCPELDWIEADLTDLPAGIDTDFDLVVSAGNVMIFLDPGSEGRVLHGLGAHLIQGGLLVSGFGIRPGHLSLWEYDRLAGAAGLEPMARWATWDREPFAEGDYAVSVHRRPD
jgi:SAM-dependent methyltransferase